ncbi:hypothetical protein [Gracilimonas tropica]|uniref:hypothetical protein n=1 Tax=Gracilimonas tropica TaxID=454600 RepID=UPI00038277C8|nr:hypothetical protein [Gracilimonas tropica]
MPETTHAQLKAAIKINKKYRQYPGSISEFARNLVNPDTQKRGVTHTAVIRVAQGFEKTEWISKEIRFLIEKAKDLDPEYFKSETNFLVS